MADFEVLCCSGFQEDTAVLLLLRLLIYHMESTEVGLNFILNTYFFTNRLENPSNFPCFYALKFTHCGRELTQCLKCRKSQFSLLTIYTNRE